MDEIGTESVIEKSETTVDNEDESDQAKASLLFVHSIVFTIIFTNFCYFASFAALYGKQ
jgi:hypothetical protein